MTDRNGRRAFLTIAGASAVLAACRKDSAGANGQERRPAAPTTDSLAPQKDDKGDDVSAVEDLMREHGVIRRVLVVYREAAVLPHGKPSSLSPQALQRAAKLMRAFAEDYHER
jgi:hypothetical protein